MNTEENNTQLPQSSAIGCLSFSAIFEDCAECGKVTPFVDTLKCFYCGCDSPFGNYHDFDIPDEEIENYIETQTITFGLISEIKDESVIGFLNNL